jgi:hypothetical protein
VLVRCAKTFFALKAFNNAVQKNTVRWYEVQLPSLWLVLAIGPIHHVAKIPNVTAMVETDILCGITTQIGQVIVNPDNT